MIPTSFHRRSTLAGAAVLGRAAGPMLGCTAGLALGCTAGLVLGCTAEQPRAELPADDVAALLLDESEARGYPEWDSPPGQDEARVDARGPHGGFVEVHLNPVLSSAATQMLEPGADEVAQWPTGSWAVVLGFDAEEDEDPMLIGIARKDEPTWVWAQLTGDGQAIDAGRPDDCVGCHGGADDFVFSVRFPKL